MAEKRRKFGYEEIPLTFILVAVVFVGQQVIQGIFVNDSVSQMAHIIGGLVGGFIGYKVNSGARYGRK